MAKLFFNKWTVGLVLAVIYTLVVYFAGASNRAAAIKQKLADDRITILQDGKEIDNEVDTTDDTGLCALLGGCELPEPSDGN